MSRMVDSYRKSSDSESSRAGSPRSRDTKVYEVKLQLDNNLLPTQDTAALLSLGEVQDREREREKLVDGEWSGTPLDLGDTMAKASSSSGTPQKTTPIVVDRPPRGSPTDEFHITTSTSDFQYTAGSAQQCNEASASNRVFDPSEYFAYKESFDPTIHAQREWSLAENRRKGDNKIDTIESPWWDPGNTGSSNDTHLNDQMISASDSGFYYTSDPSIQLSAPWDGQFEFVGSDLTVAKTKPLAGAILSDNEATSRKDRRRRPSPPLPVCSFCKDYRPKNRSDQMYVPDSLILLRSMSTNVLTG